MEKNNNYKKTYQKLQEEILPSKWIDLKEHYKADRVIILKKSENLIEVGVAMACDNKKQIESLMKADLLKRPSPKEAKLFEKNENKEHFVFIVIQPFIIIQEKPELQ